jgi:hypothetical protein
MRHIKEELVDCIFLNSDLFLLNEDFFFFFRWASFAPSQGPNPRWRRRGCFEQRNLQMPFLFRNIFQSFIYVWGKLVKEVSWCCWSFFSVWIEFDYKTWKCFSCRFFRILDLTSEVLGDERWPCWVGWVMLY